jgi:hypothetical protein
VIRILRVVSVSALILAVTDILFGYFPWYNFSVVSGPVANILLLSIWTKLRNTPRLFGDVLFFANTLCGLLVTVTYFIAE